MTSIINSSTLGLFNTSLELGSSAAGRTGQSDRVTVNENTGNLIVQQQDEYLASVGLDTALVRTYNSQGLVDGDNNDNWRLNVASLSYVPPTANASGSKVTKRFGDGAEIDYLYNGTAYVSTAGGGASDTLTYSTTTTQWTWTDGSSRVSEIYNSAGKLQSMKDTDGNTTAYSYNVSSGYVTQIDDAAANQTLFIDYDTNTGKLANITKLRVVVSGVTQTLTSYRYDTANRLDQVTVDLTPDNTADAKTYVTGYTYDGTSTRIATITAGDSSTVSFKYALINGQYRVTSTTDGEGKTTKLTYTQMTTGTGATTSATANSTALSAAGSSFNLINSALTTPTAGWATAALRESLATAPDNVQVTFDQNGNGMAVWAQGSDLYVSLYNKNSDAWSTTPTTPLRGTLVGQAWFPHLSMSANGNALVTWMQDYNLYACRYINGAWDASPSLIENTTGQAFYPVGAINDNGRALVVFSQNDGVRYNLVANVFNGSAWQSAVVNLDDRGLANDNGIAIGSSSNWTVAIDAQGNATVSWLQKTGSETVNSLYTARYTAVGTSWSNASGTTFETSTTSAVNGATIGVDGSGNMLVVWKQGTAIYSKAYTKNTDTWSTTATTVVAANVYTSPQLSMSSNGNALLTWTNDGDASLFARRYAGGVWQGSTNEALESLSGAVWRRQASINDNGQAAVAFVQTDATGVNSVYVNRYSGGAWQGATAIETNANSAVDAVGTVSVAIDALGDVNALWLQKQNSTDTSLSVYSNRYNNDAVPYYTIVSGDTWSTIATKLYGDSRVASALQTAMGNPPLTAGNRLTNLPATLNTGTTAAYYTVQAGDTWASIAQTVYGDARAASALQTAMGGTLTVSRQLTVPTSLSYTQTVSAQAQTDVTDPLGLMTSYVTDTQGRLKQLLSPAASDGTRLSTSYQYTNDDLTQITHARGNITTLQYDANGNCTLTRDAEGNTVVRTYDTTTNALLTETFYLTPDPDGAGAGTPGSPLTTHYVYDFENHLRFAISADGRVAETRYNTNGTRARQIAYTAGRYSGGTFAEADLTTWAGLQTKTAVELMVYAYSVGQLASVTTYGQIDGTTGDGVASSASITRYVYDQRGRLLKSIDARGEATATDANDYVTAFIYDGLGRITSSTQWIAKNGAADVTRTTLTTYDDANRKTTVTLDNGTGLATVSAYDRAGRLLSTTQSQGTTPVQPFGVTSYQYDTAGRLRITTDPLGNKTHLLYDEAGRLVGTVDATGSLIETVYDANGNAVKTIAYANRPTAALTDVGGNPLTITMTSLRPTLDTTKDRVTRYLYDNANRLVYTITPEDTDATKGYVAKTLYDGASRVTGTIRYANTLTIPTTPTLTNVTPTGDATNDRTTRFFYDNDGKSIGTLDAEGYLTESKYDAAGQLIDSVRYANVAGASLRAAGTFAQIKTDVTTTVNTNDQHAYTFYNARGQVIATLDAENYLTEYAYDVAGNQTQTTRYYAKAKTYTGIEAIVDLRPTADANDQVTVTEYNGANQVTKVTVKHGTDTVGTSMAYTYDSAGNLIKTERAWNTTEVRTTQARYDAKGRVLQELTAEGSVKLAALPAAATQVDKDAVWSSYSLTYTYDLDGRRTSVVDQNGNKTLFYYDEVGHLRYTVNALGEVSQSIYNAFGQVIDTIRYTKRLASLTGLTGGVLNSTVITAITPVLQTTGDNADSHQQTNYTLRGAIRQALNAPDNSSFTDTTTYSYNAFGELKNTQAQLTSTITRSDTYLYDRRGLLKQTNEDDVGAAKLNRQTSSTYDAFGRVATTTDARGVVRNYAYDRLGREITTTVDSAVLNLITSTTYDVFSRVLTQTDALNNKTTYSYDDLNRSFTITTQEGVKTITRQDRHGETVQLELQEANGSRVTLTSYQYDVNGKLLSETIDPKTIVNANDNPNGLALATNYTYDAAGRNLTIRDAANVTTKFSYDNANRVLTCIVDPKTIVTTNDNANGLNLTTSYSYDGQSRTVNVTGANGIVTQTTYDAKGQVKSVTVDPKTILTTNDNTNGLNLRADYTYDLAGRTLTVVEGAGSTTTRTTQYSYDNLGRRTQQIVDPGTSKLAITTDYVYDTNDNLAATIEASGKTEARTTRYVYDKANRLTYTVDATGAVTKTDYDKNGNVIATTRYATAISLSGLGNVLAAVTVTTNAKDETTRTVYDTDNRAVYQIDALNQVTRNFYDAAGRVIRQTTYAAPITVPATLNPATLVTAVAAIANSANDQTARTVYDTAGRARYAIDALGGVTENRYDAAGRVIDTYRYPNTINADSIATLRDVDVALHATWSSNFNSTAISTGLVIDTTVTNVATVAGQRLVAQSQVAATTSSTGFRQQTTQAFQAGQIYRFELTTDVTLTTRSVTVGLSSTNTGAAYRRHAIQIKGDKINTNNQNAAGANFTDLGTIKANTTYVAEIETSATGTTLYFYEKGTDRDLGIKNLQTGSDWGQVRIEGWVYSGSDVVAGNSPIYIDNLSTSTMTTDATVGAQRNRAVYDSAGRQTFAIDAEKYVTQNFYDALGHAVKTTSYAKAMQGTLTAGTAPTIGGTTGAYVTTDSSNDRTTRAVYDSAGRAVYSVDGDGYVTQNQYNSLNQLTKTIDYAASISLTDAEATATGVAGKLPSPIPTTAIQTNYTYDAAGRVTDVQDGEGSTTHTVYNALGQATDVTRGYGSAPSTTHYVYDAVGRVIDEIEGYGSNEFADTAGQLEMESGAAATAIYPYITSNATYTYAAGITLRAEVNLGAVSNGRALGIGLDNGDWDTLAAGYRRMGAYFLGTSLYANHYDNGGLTDGHNDLLNGSTPVAANTTYIVEVVLNSGSTTLYVYQKGLTRNDAWSQTVNTTGWNKVRLLGFDYVGPGVGASRDAFDNISITNAGASLFVEDFSKPTTQLAFTNNASGAVWQSVRAVGSDTRYTYDSFGNRASTIDPRGIELAESDSAWALAERQRLGYTDTGTAAGNALRASVLNTTQKNTLRGLYTTSYQYDKLNRQTQETDALSNITSTKYDAFDNKVKVTDPRSNNGYFYYDQNNRLTRQVDPLGYVTDTAYNAFGDKLSLTQYATATSSTSWSETSMPATPTADSNRDMTTQFQYDLRGQVKQTTDAEGFAESYTYNAFSERASLVAKSSTSSKVAGGTTNYLYNKRGLLKEEQLPINSVDATGAAKQVKNTYDYDAFGNRTTTTEAVGLPEVRTTTYTYNKRGQLKTKALASVSVYKSDWTTATVTPTETYDYDDRGNRIAVTDAVGGKTVTYYDALDRKIAAVNAAGTLMTWTLDAAGNSVAIRTYGDQLTLPVGTSTVPTPINTTNYRETRYRFDANNHQIESRMRSATVGSRNPATGNYEIGVADIVTTQVYDGNGNVIRSVDANGNTSYFYYDKLSQKTLTVDPANYVTRFEYDAAGNLMRQTQYAAKLSLMLTPASPSDPTTIINNVNPPATPNPDNRVTEYDRNKMGRVTQQRTLSVGYVDVDSGTGATTTRNASAATSYIYNGLGQAIQQTNANSNVSNVTYDSAGRKTQEQGASFSDHTGTSVRASTLYTYDGLGNVVLKRAQGNTSTGGDEVTRYFYNANGWFTSQIVDPKTIATANDNPNGLDITTTYKRDANGNITSQGIVRKDADGTSITDTTQFAYDKLNRQINQSVQASNEISATTQQTHYNTYGEIDKKGTNGTWTTFSEYNDQGKVWRTNTDNGITTVHLYDKNGNATLKILSSSVDLATYSLNGILNTLTPDQKSQTISVYDARNQVVDTYEEAMVNARDKVASQQLITKSTVDGSGGVVNVGPMSAPSTKTSSDPITNGAAMIAAGGIGSASWTFSASRYVTVTKGWAFPGYVNPLLTVNMPSNLSEYGGGNVQVRIITSYPRVNSLGGYRVSDPHFFTRDVVMTLPSGSSTLTFSPTDFVDSSYYITTVTGGAQNFLAVDMDGSSPTNCYLPNISISIEKVTPAGNVLVGNASVNNTLVSVGLGAMAPLSVALPAGNAYTKRINFEGQSQSATHLTLFYRTAGSNSGWLSYQVPQMTINGQPQPGWFVYDWSGLAGGNYEMRYVTYDDGGTVYNSQTLSNNVSGTVDFTSSTPAALTQTARKIGGGGLAFLDIGGFLNVTEQGNNATQATIRFRPVGSSYGATYTMTKVVNGWFMINPTSSGLTAGVSYDYTIVAKDGAGNTINTAQGSFTAGSPNSVGVLTPLSQQAEIVHIANQSASATSARLLYKANGTSTWSSPVTLTPEGAGSFYWDATSLVPDSLQSYVFDYEYQIFDNSGRMINRASGQVRLGANGAMLSHTNLHLPTKVTFNPPQTNATSMRLYYRSTGTTAYNPYVALTKDTNGFYTFDATGITPASGTADFDYYYELYDSTGAQLKTPIGDALQVSGKITIGSPSDSTQVKMVILGSNNLNNVVQHHLDYNAFGEIKNDVDGRGAALMGSDGTWATAERKRLGYVDGTGNALTVVALTTAQKQTLAAIYTTSFTYNTMGKLVSKVDPQTSITLANGFVQRLRPTTNYYYDRVGNVIRVDDPNLVSGVVSGRNTQTWVTSGSDGSYQVAKEFHADGGTKRYTYDVFGNLRISTDEDNRATTNFYDKANRLIEVDHALKDGTGKSINIDKYEYDAEGHRIASTNGMGSAYRTKTYYDSFGRVRKYISAEGRTTTYDYVWDNTIKSPSGATVGGYVATTTDNVGRTLIDKTDTFGNLVYHKDLGGHTFNYTYNKAGWLTSQTGDTDLTKTGTEQSITYSYYANGRLKGTTDNTFGTYSIYEYDVAGNRTFEGYATMQGGVPVYRQLFDIKYDERNRMVDVKDSLTHILYEYDANGNRRRVQSHYQDGVAQTVGYQDYWYTYDTMNRFTTTMGTLVGGRGSNAADTASHYISRGTDGTLISYDNAGQRLHVTDASGQIEDYVYNDDGFLTDVTINTVLASRRVNDAIGRVKQYVEYNDDGTVSKSTTNTYNKDNDLTQVNDDLTSKGTNYSYLDSGNKLNAEQQSSTTYGGSDTQTTNTYTYEYWDSAKQSTIKSQASNSAVQSWAPGYSHFVYDVNGHITQVRDEENVLTKRYLQYLNDADGRVLIRNEIDNTVGGSPAATGGNIHRYRNYYYANGRGIGDIGNDPKDPTARSRMDYAQSLAYVDSGKPKDFRPVNSADFDQNYQPINPSYPASAPDTYVVRQNDTLQSIALALWGDASMWYMIADANGIKDTTVPLSLNARLVIPNKVTNIHNTSQTYKVYRPGEVLGDTSPTLPKPIMPPPPPRPERQSSDGGCGGFGSFLVAVVIIVVAATTQQWWITQAEGVLGSGVAAEVVGAAAAGATANLAGQATGVALGVQNNISWEQVGISALSAGATAGIGSSTGLNNALGELGDFGAKLAKGVIQSTVTQGLAVATGLQKEFNWRDVAASAVSAGVGYSMRNNPLGNFGSSLASSAAQQWVKNGKVDWASATMDAAGQTLGSSLAQQLMSESNGSVARSRSAGLTPRAAQNLFDAQANNEKIVWSWPYDNCLDRAVVGENFSKETYGISPYAVHVMAPKGEHLSTTNRFHDNDPVEFDWHVAQAVLVQDADVGPPAPYVIDPSTQRGLAPLSQFVNGLNNDNAFVTIGPMDQYPSVPAEYVQPTPLPSLEKAREKMWRYELSAGQNEEQGNALMRITDYPPTPGPQSNVDDAIFRQVVASLQSTSAPATPSALQNILAGDDATVAASAIRASRGPGYLERFNTISGNDSLPGAEKLYRFGYALLGNDSPRLIEQNYGPTLDDIFENPALDGLQRPAFDPLDPFNYGPLKFGLTSRWESVVAGRVPELVEGAYSLNRANRAVIYPRKLAEYALNPEHPVGGNKAKVFESTLGFTRNNADDLMDQLRQGVVNNTPIPGKVDRFGSRFTVDIPVVGPAGNGTVRSGWIYKPGSNVPELTTIYVK
ncbi:MAG: LysM peptidoglycan-binding domain-containing protein [Gammaproteobacteria bacterium]|nr:LysM peptidoglycan-binding domain-containing protein [Gammaproteobacteria bacterium]